MAGISLYNIPLFVEIDTNTIYNINDIVRYQGLFYYSLIRQSSGTFDSSKWGGIINYNGTNRPNFIWTPAYNSSLTIKPNVKTVQFGDGYSANSPDGINNILLPFNLTFDKRDNSETKAILHFLNQRKGAESFIYQPPFPYNINKIFICKNWDFSTIFENNHTIRAEFIEVAA